MAKNTLMTRLSTTSNHVGIALIVALTNDAEIDMARLKTPSTFENYSSPFTTSLFHSIDNPSVKLAAVPKIDAEDILFDFASKMLSNATDTDPDIKKALQKGYWDML
jgi:hypothetical protein